jgi:hypothetical protein
MRSGAVACGQKVGARIVTAFLHTISWKVEITVAILYEVEGTKIRYMILELGM